MVRANGRKVSGPNSNNGIRGICGEGWRRHFCLSLHAHSGGDKGMSKMRRLGLRLPLGRRQFGLVREAGEERCGACQIWWVFVTDRLVSLLQKVCFWVPSSNLSQASIIIQ